MALSFGACILQTSACSNVNNGRKKNKKTKGGEWGTNFYRKIRSGWSSDVSLQMQYYQVKKLLGTKVEDEGPGNYAKV